MPAYSERPCSVASIAASDTKFWEAHCSNTRESITAAAILVIVPFQIWNAKMPDPNMTALPDKQRDFRFSEALAILS